MRLFGLLLFSLAFGHDAGHGPTIEGLGPKGGKLVAIIHAKDAEKGQDAEIQGVAEWSIRKTPEGREVSIQLYAKDRKTAITSPKQLKWIQLGKSLPKPLVTSVNEAKSVMKTFPEADFLKTQKLEVILVGFGDSADKHVVSISL
ncbi:MAG: hypothetical protein JNL01_04220 [Bdellovibrionales bacterium]|nr:hypothetical protein [Bdellovibrionales bacterium]